MDTQSTLLYNTPISLEKVHVLVVEDNVSNFVLIARLLAHAGIKKCEWKTTGWEVVEFAHTMSRVDLILMDLRLPHEDGYQALAQIRQDPILCDTRVVAITAHGSTLEMAKAKQSGFDGFISKPLDADQFPKQIERILRGEAVWDLNSV